MSFFTGPGDNHRPRRIVYDLSPWQAPWPLRDHGARPGWRLVTSSQRWPSVAVISWPGWKRSRLLHVPFFSTYLLIFRSLTHVKSQNQDLPTPNTTFYDISQNQRSRLLDFPSMLKTSLLIGYSLLYHILKNDVHTGKCGQGVLQSVIDDIEAIASLYIICLWYQRTCFKRGEDCERWET